jgi:hypothetical protein
MLVMAQPLYSARNTCRAIVRARAFLAQSPASNRKANEALSKRRRVKCTRIQTGGTFTVGDV